jgi:hypothetical protein
MLIRTLETKRTELYLSEYGSAAPDFFDDFILGVMVYAN